LIPVILRIIIIIFFIDITCGNGQRFRNIIGELDEKTGKLVAIPVRKIDIVLSSARWKRICAQQIGVIDGIIGLLIAVLD